MNAQSNPLAEATMPSDIISSPETPAPSVAQISSARKSSSAFRTIREVADELSVQQHVLRFWETKFSQIRPLKRGGGRRYYRPEDVELLKTIHRLLYGEGYTIKGAQKLFRDKGKNEVVENSGPKPQEVRQEKPAAKGIVLTDGQRATLKALVGELKELRGLLEEGA